MNYEELARKYGGAPSSDLDALARQYGGVLTTPAKPSTERTIGEAAADIPAAALSGLGSLLQFPGQLVKLVPGLAPVGEALEKPGEFVSEAGEKLKSEGLKAREALRSKALSEAEKDGILAQFATAITSTISDPALITSFLVEQVPLLLGPGSAAKITQMVGAKSIQAAGVGLSGEAAKEAVKEAAKKVSTRAYGAAYGTGAAMQAADVSSDAYDEAFRKAKEMGMSDDQAQSLAADAGRVAGIGAGSVSLLAQRLPGAKAIEQRLAKVPGTSGKVGAAFGEALAEGVEEGGGQVFKNLGLRQVDPNQPLLEGVGGAAGLGVLGGGVLGGVLGKKGEEERFEGQREGETDRQYAARLQREIAAGLRPAEPAPAPSKIPTDQQLFTLAAQPNGYGLLENMKQRLNADQSISEEDKQAAVNNINSIQERMTVEEIGRQRSSTMVTEKDLLDLGFTPAEAQQEGGIVQTLRGKDLGDEAQSAQVFDALNVELAKPDLTAGQRSKLETTYIDLANFRQNLFPEGQDAGVPKMFEPPKAEAPKILSSTELFDMAAKDQYGAIEQYKQGLKVGPQSEEVRKAIADAEFVQRRMNIEAAQRREVKGAPPEEAPEAVEALVSAETKAAPAEKIKKIEGPKPKAMPARAKELPQPPAPKTPEQEEAAGLEKGIRKAEAQRRALVNKSDSLWSVLQGKLAPFEVSDVSPDRQFKALQRKGSGGESISTLVANGDLDLWLPPDRRLGMTNYDENENAEYIKDLLRGGKENYITYDTRVEVEKLFGSVAGMDLALKNILSVEEANAELETLRAEFLRAEEERTAGEIKADVAALPSRGAPKVLGGPKGEVIDVEARIVEETLGPKVAALPAPQIATLEKHYGVDKDSPTFLRRIKEDVVLYATKGGKAVAAIIRPIIRNLHAAVLSLAVIFNPTNISPAEAVVFDKQVITETKDIRVSPPESVASKMSDGAREAYSILYPSIKDQLQRDNKLMLIVDKPRARMFVFTPDGQPLLDKKVLLGRATGDLYKGNNDLPQNRVTPAGLFKMGLRDADRSIGEARTAGEYDFKKVFVLDKAIEGEYSVTLFHSVWLKESDAALRAKALKSESETDSRYSFGCINVDRQTYERLITDHLNQMDGASLFIVPDNAAATAEFLTGATAKNVSGADGLTRTTFTPAKETIAYEVKRAGRPGELMREVSKVPVKKSLAEVAKGVPTGKFEELERKAREAKPEEKAPEAKAEEKPALAPEIQAKIAILEKVLRKNLAKFGLKDVDLNLEEGMADEGSFSGQLIRIALDSPDPLGILRHESIHALKEAAFFTDKQWATLEKTADEKWIDQYLKGQQVEYEGQRMSRYDAYMKEYGGNMALIREEAIADAFRAFSKKKPAGLMGALTERMKNFFKAVKSAFNSQGIESADEIFGKIEEGKLPAPPAKAVPAGERKSLRAPTTEAFKQWFGDSQVVDESGNPLVVYHGMPQEMEGGEFRRSTYGSLGEGIYFTGDPEAASRFATGVRGTAKQVRTGQVPLPRMQGMVLPVYLKIDQPFDDNFLVGNKDWQEWAASILRDGRKAEGDSWPLMTRWQIGTPYYTQKTITSLHDKLIEGNATVSDLMFLGNSDSEAPWGKKIVDAIQKHGSFDGIILQNSPKGFDEYVVFKPNQVKSATGNIGTFEPTSPDIRKSLRTAASSWTDERVEKLVNDYGYTDGKTYGFAAWISPEDFLRATTYSPEHAQEIRSEAEDLTSEDLQKKATPYLRVNLENGQILGHEGRHRMAFLTKEGVSSTPVVIVPVDSSDRRISDEYKPIEALPLQGQKFGEEGRGIDTVAANLVPLVYTEQKRLKKDFANPERIRYSMRSIPTISQADEARLNETIRPRHRPGFIERMVDAISGKTFSYFREQIINEYNEVAELDKRVAAQIRAMGGAEQMADQRAETACLFSSQAAAVASSAMGTHTRKGGIPVYRNGIVTVDRSGDNEGLVEIFAPLATTGDPRTFQDYHFWAAVNRAKKYILNPGQTRYVEQLFEKSDIDLANQLERDYAAMGINFKDIRSRWIKYNNGLVKLMRDTGAISERAAREFMDHGDYFPFYRQINEEDMTGPKTFSTIAGTKPPKAAKGSEEALGDFFETVIRNTQAAISISMKNVAAQRVTAQALRIDEVVRLSENPQVAQANATTWDVFDSQYADTISAPDQASALSVARNRYGANATVDASPSRAGQWNIFKPVKIGEVPATNAQDARAEAISSYKYRPDASVYKVLENGQPVYYRAYDIKLINALKALNTTDLPFLGLLSAPANLLRTLVTKDPGYMLVNQMRDSLSAWVTSGVKLTPIADSARQFARSMVKETPEMEAIIDGGVIGGYQYTHGTKEGGVHLEKQLRKKAGVKTIADVATSPFTSLWAALEKGTEISDGATRAEVYKRVLAETGNEAEALWQAAEVLNFYRHGRSPVIRVLTAIVPFLNSRIQGLDVLYRAGMNPMLDKNATDAQKQRMKTFWVRGMTLMALSSMYWALTHDDDEYKKQEQETRDNFWLIPSLGIKIAIPFEVGVIFKVLPERILANLFGQDTGKETMESLKRQLQSTFMFTLIPQALLPYYEVATNFSFYTQRPILGKGMEGVAPRFQVSPGTSSLAQVIADKLRVETTADSSSFTKALAKQLEVSPIALDHLIKGYTGTLGQYAVEVFDAIYNLNNDVPKPSKRFEQLPIIKRLALDPDARGNVTAFYDLKNSVDEVVRTSNLLTRSMNFKEWGPYMSANFKMLATQDYVNDLEKSMAEYRDMKRMVQASGMSPDSKRDTIRSIEKMENSLARNIQTFRKAVQG